MDVLSQRVLDFITKSPDKVRFGELVRHFSRQGRPGVRQLKSVVAGLVAGGELCYTSHFGSSFIERAYDRPCRVSRHVVIKPPHATLLPAHGQCIVEIERGAAFGGGEHVTTRMAIDLIDDLLHHPSCHLQKQALRAIDIGTGSGVLALAAAALGVGRVHAIDTDPCAVFEARRNIRRNGLAKRITVAQGGLELFKPGYDMIIANLRAPTLMDLRHLVQKTNAGWTALVFSGLKDDEVAALCRLYREAGFRLHRQRVEKGWGAVCLIRAPLVGDGAGPI